MGQADSEPVLQMHSFSACVPSEDPRARLDPQLQGEECTVSQEPVMLATWKVTRNPQALPLTSPESRALALCTCLPTPSGKYLFSPLRAGLAHRAVMESTPASPPASLDSWELGKGPGGSIPPLNSLKNLA